MTPQRCPDRVGVTVHPVPSASRNTPSTSFFGCLERAMLTRYNNTGRTSSTVVPLAGMRTVANVAGMLQPSELLHEAQFTRGTTVVVELGIAVAGFADNREFGAEPQHRQCPVVGGEPVGKGAVLARAVIFDEGEPAPLVVRSAHLRAAVDREAPGQGHGDTRAEPSVAPELRPLLRVTAGEVDPYRRRNHPRAAQGRIAHRAVEVGPGAAAAFVPGGLGKGGEAGTQRACELEAVAQVAVVRCAGAILAGTAEKARLRRASTSQRGPR